MHTTLTTAESKLAWRVDAFQANLPSRTEVRLAALTLLRLSLVPVIVLSFLKVPAITAAAILLFVVGDIFDGVLARKFEADGPKRRALDSLVDRIGIDAGILGAYLSGILPLALLILLLARDAYCAVICIRMVVRRNVAIKADWMYRALNLCFALGAFAAPFLSERLWVSLASVLFALSLGVAIDLTRSVRLVERAPARFRNVVLGAGSLRNGALAGS